MHIRPFIPSVDGPDLTHRVADHFTPDRKLADPAITLDMTDMGDILP